MRIEPQPDAEPTDFANSADVAEQRADLDDADPDDAGFAETSRTGAATALRAELPLEANPADVVEQDAAVPYDDER
jgi:hypothetical protein